MKETSFTSLDYSCWCKSVLTYAKRTLQILPLLGLFLFGTIGASAQGNPNCTNINASVGLDGMARVLVGEFVTNAITLGPIDVEITGAYGQRIFYETGLTALDVIELDACRYLDQQLKLNVTSGGACWSFLTFKQSNGPIIDGRTKTVWCLDPLVSGGHIHGVPPTATIPCRGTEDASFVADWIDAKFCDDAALGTILNDTAKIIYREYEAFDKEGVRGSGFDTIIVLRLPQINDQNSFCPEKDTVYCGTGGKLGPYMIAGYGFDFGAGPIPCFNAISFVESSFNATTGMLEFHPAEFDPKCGISVHVDAWKLDGGLCQQQYKVNVEIKQSCYGTPGLYTQRGIIGTITGFSGSFHPKHWRYKGSTTANVLAGTTPVFVDPGSRLNPALKLIADGAVTDYTIANGSYMCVDVPHTGTISVTATGGSYILNGGAAIPLNAGANTIPVEVCDEICFVGPTTLNGFSYTEDVVADGPLMPVGDPPVPGYWKCEFWVVDLDTLPPMVECKLDYANEDLVDESTNTVYVPASSHDCAAHTYIPPVRVEDDWAGVKYVKAIIPGVTTVVLEPGDIPNCYESHQQVKIPHGDIATPIYYEAYDNCHNVAYDTCYMKVKDLTRPVPVCDKGVIVGLSGKKVWVDAETFDEGSWDNCGIALTLARRSDWYEHCVDLCDDVTAECYYHYDTVYCANLEDDKHIDPVEAHYYKTMKWLKEDGRPCTDLLWNAWKYDLMKHATLKCVDHPYEVDDHYFKNLIKENALCTVGLFENDLGTGTGNADDFHELFDLWANIGGGWSDAVPFDCEDACKNVSVELLVVDYWCNWAKCWESVWVEDKTPISVKYDVQDQEITCGSYKEKKYDFAHSDHPVSVEYIVDLAKDGDEYALKSLDDLFGGYEKVWIDEYGNTPDRKKGGYWNQVCECDNFERQHKVYDEHLGYVWETEYYDSCWVQHDSIEAYWGQVVVNCAATCEQTVWCEFDHCGQGYIFRKWTFAPGCSYDDNTNHYLDTITRKQVIWVGNECELEKGMIYKPEDTYVFTCGIEYDDAGNATGDLDPEFTGTPEYMFDDDCRIVGISHSDKVFKIVGGDEACYKIIRTWHFMDWCHLGGKPENDQYWWLNPEYQGTMFDWEQKIIVQDTTPPVCTFVEELEEVEAPGCYYTLNHAVDVTDACGVLNYYWELHQVKSSGKELVETGEGNLEGESDQFVIEVPDLGSGDYLLKVRITDECQNEAYCEDEFTIITGKKPAAICITSLTAELTPWDIDQDGTVDSAKATIWAAEFDASSEPACGSDGDLEFRIEIIDGEGDEDPLDDSTSLTVSCEHVGNLMIRLWVVDPSGSYDFCDVILIVQNNMGGCGDNSSSSNTIVGSITNELEESVEQVSVRAELNNGQVLNYLTTASGAYAFAAALGLDVTVTPVKDISDLNGISTLDLVKIQKHILGKETLNSMYRKVAADANADDKITTVDLVQLRRLILGKDDKLQENTSWRFFDAKTSNEQYDISAIDGLMQLDWVGVKIGDINLDSDPGRSAGRSNNHLVMNLDDEIMTAGQEYRVEFRAGAFNDITGFQYTLRFDQNALAISDIEAGALDLSEENFNLQEMEAGVITSSWNSFEGITMAEDEVLFTLVMNAKKGALLSDVLAINSSKTTAESYNSLDQVASVALNFDNEKLATNEFVLYQNNPNPFTESTVIGFNLPAEAAVELTIFDVTGKAIFSQEGDFMKGYNQFSLRSKDLTTGVLYYQIDTDEFTATKKMIVVE